MGYDVAAPGQISPPMQRVERETSTAKATNGAFIGSINNRQFRVFSFDDACGL